MVDVEIGRDLHTRELTLNMGPQHPSTHGVLRLILDIDGEVITRCTPHVGYLHRGIEKLAENRNYPGGVPLTDRLDYISSMANNAGYCLAVERLLGIDAPERAKYIRTIVSEMARISSHLLWLATSALDIGAMTVFLYCFREREWILDLFEMLCGARLTTTYPRIGGVRRDVDAEFLRSLKAFTAEFPSRIIEYETLIDQNRIWLKRTKGIGVISARDAVSWGLTGPTLRGSGVRYDVRKRFPYDAYDKVDFEVPVGQNGDVYDRYRCRMLEMRQSNRILEQCIEKLPDGPILADDAPELDMPIEGHRKLVPDDSLTSACITFSDEYQLPSGEMYTCIEAPKGELGFYFVSDGSGSPYRMHLRAPSFIHVGAMPVMSKGYMIADLIAIIGSIDVVLGECDR